MATTKPMKIRALQWLTLFALLTGGCSTTSTVHDRSDYALYMEFSGSYEATLEQARPERIAVLEARYDELFAATLSDPANATRAQLRSLAAAAGTMVIETGQDRYRRDHDDAIARLQARGEAAAGDIIWWYRQLALNGRVDQARQVYERFPELNLPPLPAFSAADHGSDTGMPIWRADDNAALLHAGSVRLDQGLIVVATVSPDCPHSRRALTQLATDSRFTALASGRTVWLTGSEYLLDLEAVQAWNRSRPFTMMLPADRHDWPFIDAWAYPRFHVLIDGELVGRVDGWPEGGTTHQELITLLSSLAGQSSPVPDRSPTSTSISNQIAASAAGRRQ